MKPPSIDIPMAFDNGGMTLEAYFAGQALTGILARNHGFELQYEDHREQLAETAWSIAEAMIKERYVTPAKY